MTRYFPRVIIHVASFVELHTSIGLSLTRCSKDGEQVSILLNAGVA